MTHFILMRLVHYGKLLFKKAVFKLSRKNKKPQCIWYVLFLFSSFLMSDTVPFVSENRAPEKWGLTVWRYSILTHTATEKWTWLLSDKMLFTKVFIQAVGVSYLPNRTLQAPQLTSTSDGRRRKAAASRFTETWPLSQDQRNLCMTKRKK